MKLINKSLIYLSVSMLFVIGIWAFLFYHNKLEEIRKNVDANLENYKQQIIHKAIMDSLILPRESFKEGFFTIKEVPEIAALKIRERYADTMIYVKDTIRQKRMLEDVRTLTTAFAKDGRFYEVKVYSWMARGKLLIKDLFRQVLLLYLALIASIILVNNLVLKRLWKPFYSFLERLKKYQIGKPTSFPEIKTQTKEFTDLQKATTVLLLHAQTAYELQKQFIGNAAHELQTPLAIATNKLELLIEKGNLQSDQVEDIAKVMSIIERLVRLNKSLLLLSKIENRQFTANQKFSLNQVIIRSIEELEEVAHFKKVEIKLKEKTTLSIQMDYTLANIIFSNLLRNAIFHNLPGGFVTVEIAKDFLRISNTGKQEALDAEKIFNRFYKSGHNKNSSGLGLAIVKAIADLYGFSVSYRFENNLHHFELHFK